MASLRLTPNLINISIVPRRVAFLERSVGPVWAKAHDCVDAWHDVARKVDQACAEIEEDPEVSVTGIARRRAEICERTLIQLASFRSFEVAERALSESIGSLERLASRDPQQVETHKKLTQSLKDLREGVEATKRLVMERCKIRERAFV